MAVGACKLAVGALALAIGLNATAVYGDTRPASAGGVGCRAACASASEANIGTAEHLDRNFREMFASWQAIETPPPASPVTVSRAADGMGRPVYGLRSDFSGTGLIVSFSTRPPVSSGLAALSFPGRRPVSAGIVTSGFGLRHHPILGGYRVHNGIDLAAPLGTPVVASSDGVVGTADWHGGYGLYIALEHGGGVETRYGHMSRLNVAAGQRVRKGDVIGYVGSTGRSTGPHLHYEVRINGQAVNPVFWGK
jgi:murein DD-endopeptidase MepM/ murein hydrolase activator NlpD